jgi:hypothetical protein
MRAFFPIGLCFAFTSLASAGQGCGCIPVTASVTPMVVFDVPDVYVPSPYEGLSLSPAQLDAAHALEEAQYRYVTWLNYEYPLRLQQLDADIAFAQDEVASMARRRTEWNHFNVWSRGGNAFFLDAENAALAQSAAEKRLALLQTERGQWVQRQAMELRRRQMEIERARANLRATR